MQRLGTKKKAERITYIRSTDVVNAPLLSTIFGEPAVADGWKVYSGPLKRKRDQNVLKSILKECGSSLSFRYQNVGCVGEIAIDASFLLSEREIRCAFADVNPEVRDFDIVRKTKNGGSVLRFPCQGSPQYEDPDGKTSMYLTPLGACIVQALQNHSKKNTPAICLVKLYRTMRIERPIQLSGQKSGTMVTERVRTTCKTSSHLKSLNVQRYPPLMVQWSYLASQI